VSYNLYAGVDSPGGIAECESRSDIDNFLFMAGAAIAGNLVWSVFKDHAIVFQEETQILTLKNILVIALLVGGGYYFGKRA